MSAVIIDPDYVFAAATRYENRNRVSSAEQELLYRELCDAIQTFLLSWVKYIPEEKLKLLRERLERPKIYIETRKFIFQHAWVTAKEIWVQYFTNGSTDLILSITPKLILVKDKEFGMREAAFPINWS